MAYSIKIIDTALNEHIHMVNHGDSIFVSENNDGQFVEVAVLELLEVVSMLWERMEEQDGA